MEVLGNVKSLERRIERRFKEELKILENETEARIRKIKEWEKKQKQKIRKANEPRLKSAKETAKKRILNERRLRMKLEIQRKKDELVNRVLEDIKKDLKKIAHSQAYLDYIKKKSKELGKNVIAYGDSSYYKKVFGSKLRIKKGITGVILVSGNVTYDLTLDHLLESKKRELKMAISKALFGDSQ